MGSVFILLAFFLSPAWGEERSSAESDQLLRENVDSGIRSGIKAAVSGGKSESPDCCQRPLGKKSGEKNTKGRAPAIEPGSLVYADKPLDRMPASGVVSDEALCHGFEVFRKKGVPVVALRQALFFLWKAQKEGKVAPKFRYLAVADFSQGSHEKRFYLLDLSPKSFSLQSAEIFQGVAQTKTAFFQVGELPPSEKNLSFNGLRLRRLFGFPSNREGAFLQEAPSPRDGQLENNSENFVFVRGQGSEIFEKLGGTGFFYSHAPLSGKDHKKVLQQIEGWEKFCE